MIVEEHHSSQRTLTHPLSDKGKPLSTPLVEESELEVKHKDRNTHNTGWKTNLKTHKPHIFFSDIGQTPEQTTEDYSLSRLMHPEAFKEVDGKDEEDTREPGPSRAETQETPFPIIRRFNIKPAYLRWQNYDPG